MSTVYICRTPMREVFRETWTERWCFHCRSRRMFAYVVTEPVEQPSYYGPTQSIRCETCGTNDGDVFPGGYREWDE